MRYGELAHFRLIPHTSYYGASDATPLYLVALYAAWRATVVRHCAQGPRRTRGGAIDAARHVERLGHPNAFSTAQIGQYPYNYQTGAVWPHDNAMIAFGFRRYGFAAEAAEVARCISGAASHFLINQLPELCAGLQRGNLSFPVQYIGANVPQAWAAGTPFVLLQVMLGISGCASSMNAQQERHLLSRRAHCSVPACLFKNRSSDLVI